MMILNSNSIREWDQYTIDNKPISSIDLMESAAKKAVEHICGLYPVEKEFHIFVGPGNNGGDGLAIARLLSEKGFVVSVYILLPSANTSPNYKINYDRLTSTLKGKIIKVKSISDFKQIENGVCIDCILGIGLNKPISAPLAEYIDHINLYSQKVIAIDTPTGLPDDKLPEGSCIIADQTLTFGCLKYSMLFAESDQYLGTIKLLDIGLLPDFVPSKKNKVHYLDLLTVKQILKMRSKFSHKGTYGHVALACGSHGMMGAAVLSTSGALRSGVGLVTAIVPASGYDIMQISTPEAMCIVDESTEHLGFAEISNNYSAIGLGCGMGVNPQTHKWLINILPSLDSVRIALDADALNILAKSEQIKFPENCIITPHPKEFDRLFGKSSSGIERHRKQVEMSKKHKIYIILKGANTCITDPDGESFFNASGNPGMACGGSGDVLFGILVGLLGQNYTIVEACLLAVYLHGLSGDIAARKWSKESMKSGDIVDHMGEAFLKLSK